MKIDNKFLSLSSKSAMSYVKGFAKFLKDIYKRESRNKNERRKKMNKDGKDNMKVDYDELDKIRERLLTDPSYNDIEIVSTSLEEFLKDIQKPGVKFTTRGGIEELKRRVEREKKEKNNKKER